MRKKTIIVYREARPDPKYDSSLVSKLINKFMQNGNLRKAQKIVYKAASLVEDDIKIPFTTILTEATNNLKPGIEFKSRKAGGGKYRIIVKVNNRRDLILSLQLMRNAVRETKTGKPTFEKLAEEMKNAYNKTGIAFKKKEAIHKEAESSRIST